MTSGMLCYRLYYDNSTEGPGRYLRPWPAVTFQNLYYKYSHQKLRYPIIGYIDP